MAWRAHGLGFSEKPIWPSPWARAQGPTIATTGVHLMGVRLIDVYVTGNASLINVYLVILGSSYRGNRI